MLYTCMHTRSGVRELVRRERVLWGQQREQKGKRKEKQRERAPKGRRGLSRAHKHTQDNDDANFKTAKFPSLVKVEKGVSIYVSESVKCGVGVV